LINKYELNGYVQLKVNADKIKADMVFNPSMYDKWTRLMANYKASYPIGPELIMDNVNITQLGIAGISQGKMAHIILANGEKYIVGSVLPNGSVLTRVDDDGLVLSTAKGEIKYPVSTLF
jgi:Inner membrane component of T3SS, periplasmic domain